METHNPNQQRAAVVTGMMANDTIDTIRDYLPDNYEARLGPNRNIMIIGTDEAGWTLDGYVIPRLLSAMITAQEVPFA